MPLFFLPLPWTTSSHTVIPHPEDITKDFIALLKLNNYLKIFRRHPSKNRPDEMQGQQVGASCFQLGILRCWGIAIASWLSNDGDGQNGRKYVNGGMYTTAAGKETKNLKDWDVPTALRYSSVLLVTPSMRNTSAVKHVGGPDTGVGKERVERRREERFGVARAVSEQDATSTRQEMAVKSREACNN
ncbi:hypothetical protein C8R46DRAFT_1040502 [Mycena filopes]|nr:hypothetical protein C8R46DRAFT_1040502 [Mycena filopes]